MDALEKNKKGFLTERCHVEHAAWGERGVGHTRISDTPYGFLARGINKNGGVALRMLSDLGLFTDQ